MRTRQKKTTVCSFPTKECRKTQPLRCHVNEQYLKMMGTSQHTFYYIDRGEGVINVWSIDTASNTTQSRNDFAALVQKYIYTPWLFFVMANITKEECINYMQNVGKIKSLWFDSFYFSQNQLKVTVWFIYFLYTEVLLS